MVARLFALFWGLTLTLTLTSIVDSGAAPCDPYSAHCLERAPPPGYIADCSFIESTPIADIVGGCLFEGESNDMQSRFVVDDQAPRVRAGSQGSLEIRVVGDAGTNGPSQINFTLILPDSVDGVAWRGKTNTSGQLNGTDHPSQTLSIPFTVPSDADEGPVLFTVVYWDDSGGFQTWLGFNVERPSTSPSLAIFGILGALAVGTIVWILRRNKH